MRQIIESGQYVNRNLIRYNRITAGAIFFCMVASIFFHGFFVRPASTLPTPQQLSDLYSSTGVTLLVLIGFGLIFSPAKNNIWSSIGFTFFITIITFQIYHLVSGFWTLTGLIPHNNTFIWSYSIPVYLSDRNALNVSTYGNTAIGAMRCALANAIAFAAIMGRGGLLESFIITIFGTIIYEINRQVIARYCLDFGGSLSIFCWGGVYGSIVSLILYYRKHKKTAQENQVRVGGKFSYTLVSIGALFCWVFFPFLNTDIPVSLLYYSQGGINCIYCMSASVLTLVGMSCLISGRLNLKDFVYGPVVGGVIIGSSAGFMTNTVSSVLMGMGAGFFHFWLQRWEQKIKWYFLIENNVLFLYGVQGLLGGLLSSIFVQIDQSYHSIQFATSSSQYTLPNFSGQLIAAGITVAIATAAGIGVGIIISAVSLQKKLDHYHDRAYWIIEQDCISDKEDIHYNSQIDHSRRVEDLDDEVVAEKKPQIYRQVVIPPDSRFKNKFVEL